VLDQALGLGQAPEAARAVRRSSANSSTASATCGSIASSSALVQRLSLMVEWASASKTPKRSVSISSSRMGEAGTPAWLVSIMREPPSARGGWERSLRMCGVRAWRSPILLTLAAQQG
jgi:hypothetical protein